MRIVHPQTPAYNTRPLNNLSAQTHAKRQRMRDYGLKRESVELPVHRIGRPPAFLGASDEEMAHMYLSGMTTDQVAAILSERVGRHVYPSTVYKRIINLCGTACRPGLQRSGELSGKWKACPVSQDDLRNLYAVSTLSEIGERLGASRGVVSRWLRESSIVPRSPAATAMMVRKRNNPDLGRREELVCFLCGSRLIRSVIRRHYERVFCSTECAGRWVGQSGKGNEARWEETRHD